MSSSLLYGLNDRQQEAVLHESGPLVIFAGAGSGKTRVITHRVAQLVQSGSVRPWRILAVTFTNKAAAEMRQRLEALVPGGGRELWVGTFHAICARLLRRNAEMAGIRRDFVIYDDADQRAMIARVTRDMGLDDRRYAPRLVASVINRAKNEAIGPEDFAPADEFERVVQQVYAQYEARMAQASALDFGDLIYRLVARSASEPELLQELQKLYDHVLVDEYQDTNRVQYLLLRALSARTRNLCVVGDDDQSIYRFRGADRRNILDFTQHFPDARVVKLEQNYRSTQRILRVANAVVGRNLHRERKALWTENEEGSKITVLGCDDERDEAALLVKLMRMLLEAGSARRDLAVLYRTHAQSRVLEEALRFANLPYRVVGGLRFYDRAEVKDLLAYLRVVHNPDDDVSLLRVINTPPRGIGKTTVERLLDSAARDGSSVWQVLSKLDTPGEQEDHAAAARKSLQRFRAFLELLRQMVNEGQGGPAQLARTVLDQTGYAKSLQDEDSAEADARLENLQEVLGSMVEFEQEAEEPTLSAFLELVTLQTDVDRQVDADSITLMTVHAAKGLEFPVVMVAGLEEETFPHRGMAPDDDPDDLEEERRLAYVAFTRARQRLFLSHARLRRVHGELRERRPSRFLGEMPAQELERVGGARNAPAPGRSFGQADRFRPQGQGFARGGDAGRFSSGPSYPKPGQPKPVPGDSRVDPYESSDLSGMDEGVELRLGMRVRHKKFGVGQVRAVSAGTPPRVTVTFPGWGEKTLVSTYLEPA